MPNVCGCCGRCNKHCKCNEDCDVQLMMEGEGTYCPDCPEILTIEDLKKMKCPFPPEPDWNTNA